MWKTWIYLVENDNNEKSVEKPTIVETIVQCLGTLKFVWTNWVVWITGSRITESIVLCCLFCTLVTARFPPSGPWFYSGSKISSHQFFISINFISIPRLRFYQRTIGGTIGLLSKGNENRKHIEAGLRIHYL